MTSQLVHDRYAKMENITPDIQIWVQQRQLRRTSKDEPTKSLDFSAKPNLAWERALFMIKLQLHLQQKLEEWELQNHHYENENPYYLAHLSRFSNIAFQNITSLKINLKSLTNSDTI